MVETMIAVLFLGFGAGYWTKSINPDPCITYLPENPCEFVCFNLGVGAYECCDRLPDENFYDPYDYSEPGPNDPLGYPDF